MAEKRRLPVLPNAAPETPPVADDAPPPWHWIPIGAATTLAVGVVLARSLYVPYMQRVLDSVYGSGHTAQEYQRIDEHLSTATRDSLQLRLLLAAVPVATIAVLAGGFVIGRFGARTNARHGTLAGGLAMLLTVTVAGRSARSLRELLAYAALVPFGALLGHLGARIGAWVRSH